MVKQVSICRLTLYTRLWNGDCAVWCEQQVLLNTFTVKIVCCIDAILRIDEYKTQYTEYYWTSFIKLTDQRKLINI